MALGVANAICYGVAMTDTVIAAATSEKSVMLFSADGTLLRDLAGHSDKVFSVSFSTDGNRVVSASRDGSAKVWDVSTGTCTQTLIGHSSPVSNAKFSPNGANVATAANDNTVRLWSLNGTCVRTFSHNGNVNAVSWSPCGTFVASGGGGDFSVIVWDVGTGACKQTLKGHSSNVVDVAFSPNGALIATASADKSVRIWLHTPSAEPLSSQAAAAGTASAAAPSVAQLGVSVARQPVSQAASTASPLGIFSFANQSSAASATSFATSPFATSPASFSSGPFSFGCSQVSDRPFQLGSSFASQSSAASTTGTAISPASFSSGSFPFGFSQVSAAPSVSAGIGHQSRQVGSISSNAFSFGQAPSEVDANLSKPSFGGHVHIISEISPNGRSLSGGRSLALGHAAAVTAAVWQDDRCIWSVTQDGNVQGWRKEAWGWSCVRTIRYAMPHVLWPCGLALRGGVIAVATGGSEVLLLSAKMPPSSEEVGFV